MCALLFHFYYLSVNIYNFQFSMSQLQAEKITKIASVFAAKRTTRNQQNFPGRIFSSSSSVQIFTVQFTFLKSGCSTTLVPNNKQCHSKGVKFFTKDFTNFSSSKCWGLKNKYTSEPASSKSKPVKYNATVSFQTSKIQWEWTERRKCIDFLKTSQIFPAANAEAWRTNIRQNLHHRSLNE